MGVIGKIEVKIEIKASGDVFHELFGSNPHEVSTIVPDHIHGVDLHEGEFGEVGSTLEWEYTADGKKELVKGVYEVIDEENKTIKFRVIGGHVLVDYENLEVTIQVVRHGDFDAILWIYDFEKKTDLGPYPTSIVDVAIHITRGIEAHHVNADA